MRIKLFVRVFRVGNEHEEIGREQFVCVQPEFGCVFFDIRTDILLIFVGGDGADYLLGQIRRRSVAAKEHSSAVHSCSAEVSYRRFAVAASAQDDNKTAGLIFSQEAARFSADDENGELLFISFHVNACAIACAALDVDFSAAHAVADSVAAVAVYDYSSVVERVAGGVLSVAVYDYFGTVQVRAECVAGRGGVA